MQQQDAPTMHVEQRTREIGHALFSSIRSRNGQTEPWWDRWLMRQTMRDEAVKAQLFRFVDALPGLNSARQVNDHLREYLGEVRHRLPGPLGRTIDWIPHDGWLGEKLAGLTRRN